MQLTILPRAKHGPDGEWSAVIFMQKIEYAMSIEPLHAYIFFLVAYLAAETIMVLRSGVWSRKRPRDLTMQLITAPFKLVMICSMIEHYFLKTNPGMISIYLGGLFFILGGWFRVHGHYDLGKAFTPAVQEIKDGKLVDTGLYKYIRHPLYVGAIFLFLACPVFLEAWRSAFLSLVGLIGIALRIHKEERFLVEHQPGYAEYMKRTWRLIPKVF